ncbi:MAG: hypothetical protein IJB70_01845, partial [Clostridia bacterium]|nr:hypothetical protein [Clostridia bacterium]
ITYAVNFEEDGEKEIVIYLAQYNDDDELVKLDTFNAKLIAGQALTIRTPGFAVADSATKFRAFTWIDGQTPINLK